MRLERPSRELFIGEIISQTFQLYIGRFVTFFLPFLVSGLISAILMWSLFLTFPFPTAPSPGAPPGVVLQWFGDFLAALIAIIVLGGIVSWVIGSIATGMVVKSASDFIEKQGGTLQESFSFAMSRLPSLLVASIITGILTFIGFLFFVIPGIILMIIFYLVVPTIIIERKGALESLGRSSRLVSHRWLKTFVTFLVVAFIIVVISLIASLIVFPFEFAAGPPFEISSTFAIRLMFTSVVGSFVAPISPISTTLLYYSMLAKEASELPPPPPLI